MFFLNDHAAFSAFSAAFFAICRERYNLVISCAVQTNVTGPSLVALRVPRSSRPIDSPLGGEWRLHRGVRHECMPGGRVVAGAAALKKRENNNSSVLTFLTIWTSSQRKTSSHSMWTETNTNTPSAEYYRSMNGTTVLRIWCMLPGTNCLSDHFDRFLKV